MGIGSAVLVGVLVSQLTRQDDGGDDDTGDDGTNGTNGSNGNDGGPNTIDRSVPDTGPVGDDAMDRLIASTEKSSPSVEALDGFDSTTVTLDDGETVTLTTTPNPAVSTFKVKEIHFDRSSDFTYTFTVGGDQFGGDNSNEVTFDSPRVVSGEDQIISTATNNSGNTVTIDWYIRAWGEP